MKKDFREIYTQKWLQIAILLGLCLVLFFLNLNRWDLWNPDEPRYAQVAREMVEGGDWILMHQNGKIYEDKPPLFFWLIGLSSYLLKGFNSFAVRFPSALFGTLTVLLTFLLGKHLFSVRTGFFSGLILATSVEFAYLSTRANIDTTLAFFTTASLLCFLLWDQYTKEERGKKGLSIYGFYVGMALGTLTKGPIGFILPFLVSLVYLLIQKDWKGIKGMKFIPGSILMMGIILAWYVPAILKGGQTYLNETLLHQTIDRFAKGTSHIRPIYYYLYNFPVEFLPWIFFLPSAIAYGYFGKVNKNRKEFLFPLVWLIVIFLFFSLSKGKRGVYLLPLFPAASLMVGRLWDDFVFTPMEHFRCEWISFGLYGFMGLTLIAGAAVPWVISMKFSSYLPYVIPIAFLLIGSSLALFVLNHFRHYGAIFFLIVGMIAGGYFYTLRVIFPLVNPYKSARFISQEIKAQIQPSEKLAIYGDFVTGPYNFYTGIVPILELNNQDDLFRFLESKDRVFCLLKFRDFYSFREREDEVKVELIDRRKVGDDDIVLISNQ